MPHLVTTVRLGGSVVECRGIDVNHPFLVGEHPDARVSFPGLTLAVGAVPLRTPGGDGVMAVAIGGIVLVAGQSHVLRNGDLEVEFAVEAIDRAAPWRARATPVMDVRLLVATAAVLVFALWVETLDRWVRTDPEVVAEVAALTALWSGQTEVVAPAEDPHVRVLPVELRELPGEGPAGDRPTVAVGTAPSRQVKWTAARVHPALLTSW